MKLELSIEQESHFDVCVLGGGPAGFCAAVAAARNGAKTALVEKYGMLGGAMTVGGIPAPALFHAHGRQVIAGIGWELMERLAAQGDAILPEPPYRARHPQLAVRVNAFRAAEAMDDMCQEAGVALFFHQPVAHVQVRDGRILCVLVATHAGLAALRATIFIDCTGDGDAAAMAGAPFELGETLQPGSLNAVLDGFNPANIDRERADSLYAKATDAGRLQRGDIWGGQGKHCAALWDGRGSNLNHVHPLDGSSSQSRSAAEPRARKSLGRIVSWMRAEVPGCERAYVSSCSPESWARESRRITGRAYVAGADYVRGVVPADAICYSFYPIDIHTDEEDALINQFHEEGCVPGIPYGALIPLGLDNLLVAGRCISGDRAAQSAYRVQASCMAMGEAAGTAAAQAFSAKVPVWAISIDSLKAALKRQGALVP